VAIALLSACGVQPADPTAGAGFRKLVADQVIAGFEQHVTEDGKHKVLMRGDTAYIFEDSALAKVRNINLTMYDEAGNISARLTAISGDINTASQGMIARGNVVLITEQDGRRIETEELHFDPRLHRIWSDVQTVQHHEGGILTGSGFEADDKFQNVQIKQARSSGGGLRIQF
jgi:LPS export ABC transporter protein LptC